MTQPTNPSFRPPNTTLASDSQLVVVLVEPRIPQNTGNIARLCQCTGSSLYLVGSLGFRLGDKYLKRAGMDYLEDIEIHHVKDFQDVLKTFPTWTPFFLSSKAKKNYTDCVYPQKSLLVFGSEDKGLPSWLVEDPTHADQVLRIPMVSDARSLNLSTSVGIVVYEALRQRQEAAYAR